MLERYPKIDVLLSVLLLILFVALQLNFVFSIGVCCADDAHNASLAKNLAGGLGYATTIQEQAIHFSIEKFDDRIGNGPTMILPAALLITLFGNQYWVPGFTNVLVITSLLIGLGFLLKKIGSGQKLFILTILLLFSAYTLMTLHFEQWYALLGEIPAALLFIIGALLFFCKDSRKTNFLSGLAFALAVNAKLVSLLPVAVFITSAILLDKLFWRSGRFEGYKNTLNVIAPLGIGFGLPFLAMEIWKFLSLGGAGYLDFWIGYYDYVTDLGVTGEVMDNIASRIYSRTEIIHDHFGIPFLFLPVICLFSWFMIRKKQLINRLFAVLLIVIAVYTIWWLVISIGWARHYIISLMLILFIAVLPVLNMGNNRTVAVYMILLLLWTAPAWGRLDRPIKRLQGNFYSPLDSTQGMLEAVQKLDDHPREIILTQWWGSVSDLEYLMDTHLNFTSYRDKGLEPGTSYWLALNKDFASRKNQAFSDFWDSCEVIFESERHYIGECILPDFYITGSN